MISSALRSSSFSRSCFLSAGPSATKHGPNNALNEKDRLLEKQEDILYEEHDKFVNVQKSLALEIKRNEMLSSELSACHESISSLKDLNDELNAVGDLFSNAMN
jgi:hypothetical protein